MARQMNNYTIVILLRKLYANNELDHPSHSRGLFSDFKMCFINEKILFEAGCVWC